MLVVRALGLTDTVDVNLFGLEAGKTYVVSVEDGAKRTPLAILKRNPKGGGATQVTGPVRRSMAAGLTSTAARRIVVAEDASGAPVRLSAALP